MKSVVTQLDIARKLGLSRSTVTKALADDKNVAVEVRSRVMELSRELGYVANVNARNLVTKRSNTICMLMDYIRTSEFQNAWVGEIHRCSLDAGMKFKVELNSLTSVMAERSADAFVAFGGSRSDLKPDIITHHLTGANPPIVFVDCGENEYGYNSVCSGNREGAALAVRYLVDRGHRNLGFLGKIDHNAISNDRFAGFNSVLDALGLEGCRENVIRIDDWPSGLADVLGMGEELLRLVGEGVTGFLATGDLIAIAAIHILARAGIRVPEDVSLIGHCDGSASELIIPGITAIKQDLDATSDAAIAMIIASLSTGAPNPNVIIPPILVERETVKNLS